MKLFFDLNTQEIITENGEILKKLNCPIKAEWDDMTTLPYNPNRMCKVCSRTVVDTSPLSVEELADFLRKQPDSCLKISTIQTNITFI